MAWRCAYFWTRVWGQELAKSGESSARRHSIRMASHRLAWSTSPRGALYLKIECIFVTAKFAGLVAGFGAQRGCSNAH